MVVRDLASLHDSILLKMLDLDLPHVPCLQHILATLDPHIRSALCLQDSFRRFHDLPDPVAVQFRLVP